MLISQSNYSLDGHHFEVVLWH